MRRLTKNGSVFLVGFMGTGKTSVGTHLARALDWDLIDTDASIEKTEGRSIERIFADDGEGYFRKIESKALVQAAEASRVVVATGGGVFLDAGQRELIRCSGPSVWLDVPLDVLKERLGPGRGRPLWMSDDWVGLRAMFERRRATYALADHRVDGSRGTPPEIAERVLDRLRR
jgi:shikimate kinase